MTYIDILTSQLFALGFMGLTLLYIVIHGIFLYRKGKSAEAAISSGAVPLALLGFYAFISSLYGQFTWPLPGSYNILYYDIFVLVGLLFIGGAWSIYKGMKIQYIGFLGFLLGIMSIIYGTNAYSLRLSQSPLGVLGLFLLFGISGILGWPLTIMVDRAEAKVKNKSYAWILLVILFSIFIFLASVVALYTASVALPMHLKSPP